MYRYYFSCIYLSVRKIITYEIIYSVYYFIYRNIIVI